MKKLIFIALLSVLILSGCIEEPPLVEESWVDCWDNSRAIDESYCPEETIEEPLEEPKPPEEPPEPEIIVDECAWTLDIENFKNETRPTAVQAREYHSCYTSEYILKVNSGSQKDFCNGIIDDFFIADCLATLARKTNDLNVCADALEKQVVLSEVPKEVSASDACYFQYFINYNQQIDNEEETALCTSIVNELMKKYCLERVERIG